MDEKVTERKGRSRNQTTTSAIIPPTKGMRTHIEQTPEFIRLPLAGKRCSWSNLTRASLNKLILGPTPKVKSLTLRDPGAKRGIRLIHLESLLVYLHAEMTKQESNSEGGCHE